MLGGVCQGLFGFICFYFHYSRSFADGRQGRFKDVRAVSSRFPLTVGKLWRDTSIGVALVTQLMY